MNHKYLLILSMLKNIKLNNKILPSIKRLKKKSNKYSKKKKYNKLETTIKIFIYQTVSKYTPLINETYWNCEFH